MPSHVNKHLVSPCILPALWKTHSPFPLGRPTEGLTGCPTSEQDGKEVKIQDQSAYVNNITGKLRKGFVAVMIALYPR